ncbi:amidase [Kribbella sp. NBC_01245]|uniref:amidase n=1 Tax=Kribbella sp. NBC_01245 TaxID=2903578 RepID=UPI002E27F8DA|nr:amidase [Kribbella sp. NBC_01245]
MEEALGRAGEWARLNAVVHLDVEGARRAAAEHSREGALAGVPVLVKEIVEVEGLPFRCGSAAMDVIGRRDAEVVARFRAAGAIVIGLSHSHEFAYGCTGTSNRVGPCRNPHDLTRMTGGSSSGAAAAVAAGIVPLAIGTDTAGSVRIPAALCGVVGFKPEYGTLPVDGVFPLAQSLDHVGVLTTTVADAAYALAAVSDTVRAPAGNAAEWRGVVADDTGRAPARDTAGRLGMGASDSGQGQRPGLRLGRVVNEEYLDFTAEVGAVWEDAIRRIEGAGAVVSDVRLPDWGESSRVAADIQGPEAAANHAGLSTELYQADVQERLREAAGVSEERYDAARARAVEISKAMGDLLREVDAVITPTVLTTAPPIDAVGTAAGALAVRAQLLKNTRLANLTGHPAITIPLPTKGLPVGLQVIAEGNDQAIAVAQWIEGLGLHEVG